MAYLLDTVLTEWRSKYQDTKLDVQEHRLSNYGALEAFALDTPNLVNSDQIASERTAQTRATKITVIKRKTYSLTTTRACTAIDNNNVSALQTITWATLRTGFSMIPSQYVNNHVGFMEDFNRKMADIQRTFLTQLDTLAATNLNTNKTAVNAADGNPYTVTANTMVVPNDDKDNYFNELESVLNTNDFEYPVNIVASTRTKALVKELYNQGAGNSANTQYQFGDQSFHYSNRVSVATGDAYTVFAAPVGSLGYLSWVDPDSRLNSTAKSGKEWRSMFLPLLGHNVGVLFQDSCADNSTEIGAGGEASLKQNYTFSFDYSFINAYNSDSTTLAGSIYKAAISKT
jgi:hypothetical protein